MPKLTKPCLCYICKEFVQAGNSFRWVDAKRSVAHYTKGSQGITKVDCKRPAHDFDCLAVKKNKHIEELLKLATEISATKEQLKEIRTKLVNS